MADDDETFAAAQGDKQGSASETFRCAQGDTR